MMQITLFGAAPQSAAERAAASFFQAVDYALLRDQCRWLGRCLNAGAPADLPGRKLLRFLDHLPEAFAAQGGELPQRRRYWRAVHEMKAWLLARLIEEGQDSPGYGLLHLLDAVQDFATDTLGVPEHVVFPLLRWTIEQEPSHSKAA